MSNKITLLLGLAKDSLAELIQNGDAGKFDMAFIDADKANYKIYYENCLDLLRPGGLILIDNVLWSGKTANPEEIDADTLAIRELNFTLQKDKRIDLSMLPIGDGLTLARKN